MMKVQPVTFNHFTNTQVSLKRNLESALERLKNGEHLDKMRLDRLLEAGERHHKELTDKIREAVKA